MRMASVFSFAALLMTVAASTQGQPLVFSADFESPDYTLGGGIYNKPTGQTPNWDFLYDQDPAVVLDPSGGTNQCTKWVGDYTGGPSPTDVAVTLALGTDKDLELRQSCLTSSADGTPASRELVWTLASMGLRISYGGGFYTGYDSGNRWAVSDGSVRTVSDELADDVWHESVLTVHWAASTYDFVVDGVDVVTGGAFAAGSGLTEYDPWSEDEDGTGLGALYLDNVRITQVPEPVTMGMLALGMFGIAALRRRRK
jgi:hypothetical protein